MPVERFSGEVAAFKEFRTFPDFKVFESIDFRRSDGSTLKLENGIGIPAEAADVFKPGLQGDFLTYRVPMGRRGVFALRPKGGSTIAKFSVPGEGMYKVMAIVSLVTIVLFPLAILLWVQHVNTQKTKAEGEALFKAGF